MMDETRNTEQRPPVAEHADPEGERKQHEQTQDQHEQSAGSAAISGVEDGRDDRGVAELRDRWQRTVAELDNQRKRYERQLEQVRRGERDRVTAAWLPVLDHLELALQHAQADPATIVSGVRAVRRQAFEVLRGLGYRRVEEVGIRFDPTLHEAAQVVSDPDTEPNTVVAVLRPGYTGESTLLRPAVVTVTGGQE
jgi:molecular chaperone GrpE